MKRERNKRDDFYDIPSNLDARIKLEPECHDFNKGISGVFFDGKKIGWCVDIDMGLLDGIKSIGVTYEYIPNENGDSEAQYKGVWLYEKKFCSLRKMIEYYIKNKELMDDIFERAQ